MADPKFADATGLAMLQDLVTNVDHFSLHSADPGYTGASELVGNGYARAAGTFVNGADPQQIQNNAEVDFGTASADWLPAGWYGFWKGVTFKGGAPVAVAKTVLNGDPALFAAGAVKLRLTPVH